MYQKKPSEFRPKTQAELKDIYAKIGREAAALRAQIKANPPAETPESIRQANERRSVNKGGLNVTPLSEMAKVFPKMSLEELNKIRQTLPAWWTPDRTEMLRSIFLEQNKYGSDEIEKGTLCVLTHKPCKGAYVDFRCSYGTVCFQHAGVAEQTGDVISGRTMDEAKFADLSTELALVSEYQRFPAGKLRWDPIINISAKTPEYMRAWQVLKLDAKNKASLEKNLSRLEDLRKEGPTPRMVLSEPPKAIYGFSEITSDQRIALQEKKTAMEAEKVKRRAEVAGYREEFNKKLAAMKPSKARDRFEFEEGRMLTAREKRYETLFQNLERDIAQMEEELKLPIKLPSSAEEQHMANVRANRWIAGKEYDTEIAAVEHNIKEFSRLIEAAAAEVSDARSLFERYPSSDEPEALYLRQLAPTAEAPKCLQGIPDPQTGEIRTCVYSQPLAETRFAGEAGYLSDKMMSPIHWQCEHGNYPCTKAIQIDIGTEIITIGENVYNRLENFKVVEQMLAGGMAIPDNLKKFLNTDYRKMVIGEFQEHDKAMAEAMAPIIEERLHGGQPEYAKHPGSVFGGEDSMNIRGESRPLLEWGVNPSKALNPPKWSKRIESRYHPVLGLQYVIRVYVGGKPDLTPEQEKKRMERPGGPLPFPNEIIVPVDEIWLKYFGPGVSKAAKRRASGVYAEPKEGDKYKMPGSKLIPAVRIFNKETYQNLDWELGQIASAAAKQWWRDKGEKPGAHTYQARSGKGSLLGPMRGYEETVIDLIDTWNAAVARRTMDESEKLERQLSGTVPPIGSERTGMVEESLAEQYLAEIERQDKEFEANRQKKK
jgi:hypothetical protein